MTTGFLLGRVLLKFGEDNADNATEGDLSAAAFSPDGRLWVASDELSSGRITLSSLVPEDVHVFGGHRPFALEQYISLLEQTDNKAEADIEGLYFDSGYLWFTGSHSSKRPKPGKGNAREKLERLAKVEIERNRYLIGRLPLAGGDPVRSQTDPEHPGRTLTATRLAEGKGGNVLTEALLTDEHFGPFLRTVHDRSGHDEVLPLASKENGFDIEGLAVLNGRLFLGLRGPVLRGWACLLEIACVERGGLLGLAPIGDQGRLYRKHFVDLDGLGVRDLAVDGGDLLILAGPTMVLDGPSRLFRLSAPRALGLDSHDSITGRKDELLQPLFDLPDGPGGDHAEALAVTSWHGQPAVLVVYDSPLIERRPMPGRVYADIFRLPR